MPKPTREETKALKSRLVCTAAMAVATSLRLTHHRVEMRHIDGDSFAILRVLETNDSVSQYFELSIKEK